MSHRSVAGHRRVLRGLHGYFRRMRRLVTQPVFIVISIFGNLTVALGATAIYLLEHGENPSMKSPLDAVWWAVATVTTVGYGDISPVTVKGKLVGIAMMIVGTALFWSYTALFAQALISEEITDVESELRILEKRIKELKAQR